jgi:hypothetical protein
MKRILKWLFTGPDVTKPATVYGYNQYDKHIYLRVDVPVPSLSRWVMRKLRRSNAKRVTRVELPS